MNDFYDVVRARRSNYTIGNRRDVPPSQVEELLRFALIHVPSAFNSQPGRAIALFGAEHEALWDIVWQALHENVPAERLTSTREKLAAFSAGYGTLLFFIDDSVISAMEDEFPRYATSFATWAEQSTGMLQYAVWCALDSEGLGVSLQHYNPLIDTRVRQKWNVPHSWRLVSQMVLGSREAPPEEKDPIDPSDKLLVFGQ